MGNKSVDTMWKKYLKSIGEKEEDTNLSYTSWYFGGDKQTADQLAELAIKGDKWSRGYTVITFDMPLHGESRPYNDFTFYNVADDLKSILMKEKITHAVIAGQSAGGYVAQAFTHKYA